MSDLGGEADFETNAVDEGLEGRELDANSVWMTQEEAVRRRKGRPFRQSR